MNTTNKTQVWQHIANIANCAAVIYKERGLLVDSLLEPQIRRAGPVTSILDQDNAWSELDKKVRNPVDEILEMMNDALKITNKGGVDGRKAAASPAHQKGEGSDGSNSR